MNISQSQDEILVARTCHQEARYSIQDQGLEQRVHRCKSMLPKWWFQGWSCKRGNYSQSLSKTMSKHSLIGSDREWVSTPAERDFRNVVTRERVVSFAWVKQLGAGNLCVKFFHGSWRSIHDRGSGIYNGLKIGHSSSASRCNACSGDLPETGRCVNIVELDWAWVQVRVGASEIELRPLRSKVEPKLIGGNGTLWVGVDEKWVCV